MASLPVVGHLHWGSVIAGIVFALFVLPFVTSRLHSARATTVKA